MRNGWRGAFVMGLEMVALALGAAWAADGWIGFSGAVLTPTCGAPSSLARGQGGIAARRTCLVGGAGPGATAVVFHREVRPITGHEPNPLLAAYRDRAAAASSSADRPILVVRTYE